MHGKAYFSLLFFFPFSEQWLGKSPEVKILTIILTEINASRDPSSLPDDSFRLECTSQDDLTLSLLTTPPSTKSLSFLAWTPQWPPLHSSPTTNSQSDLFKMSMELSLHCPRPFKGFPPALRINLWHDMEPEHLPISCHSPPMSHTPASLANFSLHTQSDPRPRCRQASGLLLLQALPS